MGLAVGINVVGDFPSPPFFSVSCRDDAIQGRALYEAMYPHAEAYDLNQDPKHRAKRSHAILSTLTTGCSKLWLVNRGRYMTGLECLSFHAIPVTAELAMAMRCKQVAAGEVSHTMQCFMAGNSMHCANVGACVALCLFGTSLKSK